LNSAGHQKSTDIFRPQYVASTLDSRPTLGKLHSILTKTRHGVKYSFVARHNPIVHRSSYCTTGLNLRQVGPLLESEQQTAGRAVVVSTAARGLQLSLDLLGQALSELDTPLVEGVDVPNGAFGEGDVLVVGDQGTQG